MLLLQNGGNLQSSLSRQQQPLGSAFAQASTPSTAPSQSTSLQSFLSNRGSNFQSSAPSLQFEQPRSTGTQNQFNSFQNNFNRFPSQSTNSFNTQGTNLNVKSQDPNLQFAQHERDSLIGHLVGLQSSDSQLVLTPRQRQALEEEIRIQASPIQSARNSFPSSQSNNFASFIQNSRGNQALGSSSETSRNNAGFSRGSVNINSLLSSSSDTTGFNRNFQQSNINLTPQRPAEKEPFLPSLVLGNQIPSQQRPALPVPANINTESHPSEILNNLPQSAQQKFLEQFLSLTPEHQSFVYKKLLSSPADIQQFAIDQFISLDNRVLVVSIEAELEKERKRQQSGSLQSQSFIGPSLPSQNQRTRLQPTFPNNRFGQTPTNMQELNPNNLTLEELATLQVFDNKTNRSRDC